MCSDGTPTEIAVARGSKVWAHHARGSAVWDCARPRKWMRRERTGSYIKASAEITPASFRDGMFAARANVEGFLILIEQAGQFQH